MIKYNKITQEELFEQIASLRDEVDELSHCCNFGKYCGFNKKVYNLFNVLSDKAEGISVINKCQAWDELTGLNKQLNASQGFQSWLSCFNEKLQRQCNVKTRNYPMFQQRTQYATRELITEFCREFKANTAVMLNLNPEMWDNQSITSIRANVCNTLLPKIMGSYRTATVKNGSREKLLYIGAIEHLHSNVHVHLAVYNPKFKKQDLIYDKAKEEAFLLTDAVIKTTGGGTACATPLLNPAGWAAYITKMKVCCENLVFDQFSKGKQK